ncbi:hypothetical protein PAXRUDRAFT_605052 [Paxillus rubicundulus Ve08.2h10]|uniref:Unplaced genomic scaffold scaffold_51, whole genome shotgun sequence n=1 Tax=Paxillus rubicundulus Ve08.2h10 TaxID=930991 RepID=A0A0D0DVP1_9AGAM|nr:hypothetical protein PAXRUDRAFT_605052 [Paxillus rubicundulus Ve08.2h10]
MSSSDQQEPQAVQPVQVLYCQSLSFIFCHCPSGLCDIAFFTVCTFPPEYCEFGSSLTRCKEWLHETHPQLHEKYYSDGECLLLEFTIGLLMISLIRGSPVEAGDSQSGGSGKAREGYCEKGG